MTTFNDFNLRPQLFETLSEIGFNTPTEIQKMAIPVAMEGFDVLGSSKTGSGKTGAFVIPTLSRILEDNSFALVIVPTRELAIQVKDAIHQLRGKNRISTALIFGGSDIRRQIDSLRKNPNIIIATPGRLNDHIQRKTIKLDSFNILILDEFDRMLEMGFRNELQNIIAKLPQNRQTLMFSATTRQSVIQEAKKYLKSDYKEIYVGNKEEGNKNITQEFLQIHRNDKYNHLLERLNVADLSAIIFVATKRMADILSQNLKRDGYVANAIHGDLRQRQREVVIKQFRDKMCKILVATDVAARGIDVPHIEAVINYDMPTNPEDYIHRIGRTGRADKTGISISFVTPEDSKIHRAILSSKTSDEFDAQPRSGNKSQGGGRNFSSSNGFNKRSASRFGDGNRRHDSREDRGERGERGERKPFGEFRGRTGFGDGNRRHDSREDRGERGERKPFGEFRGRTGFGDGNRRHDSREDRGERGEKRSFSKNFRTRNFDKN